MLGRASWPRRLRPRREAAGPRGRGGSGKDPLPGPRPHPEGGRHGAEPKRARETDIEWRVGGLKTGGGWEIGGYGGYGGFYSYAV